MIKKIILLVLLSLISTVSNFYAQCTGCTPGPTPTSGNVTVGAGQTMCFTSNATLDAVTFGNNSKICVAPGVTVTIQNNVTSTSGSNVTLEIGGTLQFNNPPTFNANLTANVQSGGTLKSGSTGNSNFTFNGTTNTLTNNGTVQVSVLQFQNSGSTNIVDNYGTLTIGSNINISGTSTTFRNWNLINIGQSFNMNSSTTYINCGTTNTGTGFNVRGGRIINTGNFNVSTSGSGGTLDLPDGSRFENYGILDSRGSTNNNGTSSIIYNEGLVKLNTYQGNGWLRGPSSSTKKGYFETANQMLINRAKVGPNLDFKRTSGASSQSTVFNSNPTYVTSTGSTTTQTDANVTFDCRATTCSAPLVTNIGLCPNIDGTFPPQANDDAYTIAPGSSATSNVLANDFAQYNGAAATTSNVTITQVSTTNSGVNVNTSGIVSVAAGTPAGTYSIVYRICSISTPSSCDTATVTVTVPPAIDAINGSQTVNSGSTGTSVLANDTIQNGTAGSVTLGATGNATISQTSTTNAGVNIDTATGNVVVSPGTPAGTYTITYQICTKATPVTCDTAQETVTVTNLVDAVNDSYGPFNNATLNTTASVLANDTSYNGASTVGATASNVTLTWIGTAPAGITRNADGTISIASGTASGTYNISYQICAVSNPTFCDTAVATIIVDTDSDGDGVLDGVDLDDDNDGILDCVEKGFGPNSSVSTIFKLNGSASQLATNEIRLTPDARNQSGNAWSYGKVDFAKSFTISYSAYFGTKDAAGADGIATVFHNSPSGVNAIGGQGIGIGAQGIANGIVLEIDTYNNGTGVGDIANDHGQIWVSSNQSGAGLLTTATDLGNVEDGLYHNIVVNWNFATKTLSYTLDGINAGIYTFPAGTPITSYFGGVSKVYFGYTASTGGSSNDQRIRFNSFCSDLPIELDTDNDGVPNHLDVDSDNDGCADAIEGSENVTYSQIHALDLPVSDPNYAYRGQIKVKYDGVTIGSPSQIISTSASANGVPQLLNNAGNNLNTSTNPNNLAGAVDNTDGSIDVGQGIGASQDNTVNSCKCYKLPVVTSGTAVPSNHGITALGRAGADNSNWPMVRQSAWTVLEAKTKGFVVNRVANPATDIANPVEGMMVFDTTAQCLKIYNGTVWSCYSTPACP